MWTRCPVKKEEDCTKSEVRLSLPTLSTNKCLLSCRPELESNSLVKLSEEIVYTLRDDISRFPPNTRFSMRHLGSRHMEVSQWQALISESIAQVDLEITAVEQMKEAAEHCLQEKQLYSPLMSGCVAISCSLRSAYQRQDRVLAELTKEERLTNDIREMLQKQICILLSKLSSLKDIRARLLADFQDKGEAINLTTKCIIQPGNNGLCCEIPPGPCRPNHVSYGQWLSNCKNLRQTADALVKDSAAFRRHLRFTLVNLKNAQDRQRHGSDDALRKKINELSRSQDTMMWDRQRLRNEMSDRTNDVQKVVGQIKSCDYRLCRASQRLAILNQRPRLELCMDTPFVSLTMEQQDLANMAAGLRPILKRSQQDLENTHKRLMILEKQMAQNAHNLEGEKKCQNLHQSFLPALDTCVFFANKPKLRHSSTYSYLV